MTEPAAPDDPPRSERREDRQPRHGRRARSRTTRPSRWSSTTRPGPACSSGRRRGSAAILGERVVRIEHTGSTSVPGLAAKPIIDITLVVPDSVRRARVRARPRGRGLRLAIREPDWYEHRVFKGPDTNINLHVFSPGCLEIDRMVGFRDWLRTHDEDRELYERTKRELATRDLGVRPELRRCEDRGRRGDHRPRAGRLRAGAPKRVDIERAGRYRPRHAMSPTSIFDARHDRSRS